jgi:putative membrane protein
MPSCPAQHPQAHTPQTRWATFGVSPFNASEHRVPQAVGFTAASVGALSILAMLGGCDARQQKPKVLDALDVIGSAAAQQTDLVVPPAAISGAIDPVDEAFALFAASSGIAEIDAAQLVLKGTRDRQVRDYAQMLVRDHTRAADELRRVTSVRGLTLPTAPTGRHADMVTKLSGVRAQDLDEAFLRRFGIDAHKETIALFERHVIQGKDPEIRKYAERTLVTLREHLNAAQKLLHAPRGR